MKIKKDCFVFLPEKNELLKLEEYFFKEYFPPEIGNLIMPKKESKLVNKTYLYPVIDYTGKEIINTSSNHMRTYSVYMQDKEGNKVCKKVQSFKDIFLNNAILEKYFNGYKVLKIRIEPE